MIARGFFEYSQTFNDAERISGYDITRAFLGYNYQITPSLQGQVVLDGAAGKNSSEGQTTYLRNAFLRWNDKGWDVSLGVVNLLQFNTQEQFWGHRYVFKSLQDQYGFGSSVDLGITAKYHFNKYFSVDASLLNGEGYKKIGADSSSRYALGVDIKPLSGLWIRAYGDLYTSSAKRRGAVPVGWSDSRFRSAKLLALFAGYRYERFDVGVEYSKLYNKEFVSGKDSYGYSAYATVRLSPKWEVFARYDLVGSDKPLASDPEWNPSDGQMVMVGVEFHPYRQVRVSPNMRAFNPERGISYQALFVSLEFSL